jgi:TrmH family RNA methyltransferase
VITSTANPHVKYIRSLCADRRRRHRERSFVIEGVRLVGEACRAGVALQRVLYAADQLAQTPEGVALLDQVRDLPGSYPATAQVVAAAADTVTPQGVVAVAPFGERAAQPGLMLVLDAVQDPGNVGTLLRTAEAAGVGRVVCSQGTADVYSPKVVRAAMGAHFWLAVQVDVERATLADLLRDVPRVYATTGRAHTPYYAVQWQEHAALVIGNEAQGVGADVLALATEEIVIPMQGRAESLNAAVAGSIILFEALRQHATRDT